MSAAQPDPVVQTKTVTRTVCPAELATAPTSLPAIPDDADVVWNDAAKRWHDLLVDVAQAAIDAVLGARETCREAGAE